MEENPQSFHKHQSFDLSSSQDLDLRSVHDASTLKEEQHLIENATQDNAKGNLALTSFNYINSIIGSGIVGIPYAFHSVGFGMGIVLLVVIAIATDFSLCVLVEAGRAANVDTYQGLIHSQFGYVGFWFLTFIQFVYPFIAMISYNIIIGDTVTKVLRRVFILTPTNIFGNRTFVCFLATVFITYPLSLFRAIVKLSIVSFISLTFAIAIMLFVLIRSFIMPEWLKPTDNAFAFANSGVTEAIGVIAFAYMCHHNSFLLYDSLENATQVRWNRVTHISVGSSCLIMMIFGISGYVMFTGNSQGDLLENFCLDDDWANAARIIFAVTIVLTYPIECFVAKDVCFNSCLQNQENKHSYILTTLIVIAAFACSTFTDCLNIVLELNGVLAAVPLAYILPAAVYIKASEEKLLSMKKVAAALLVTTGAVIAVFGFVNIVIDISNGIKCSRGVEMPYCNDTNLY